ncbi:MAG: hypothetical protein A2X64_00905 [Ignavibacteria bacterium GWF2_33_9]|nr:MAG: hypothetical protein A2X64_00905 [Ignavibacteria bacterium GWF2_33_9]
MIHILNKFSWDNIILDAKVIIADTLWTYEKVSSQLEYVTNHDLNLGKKTIQKMYLNSHDELVFQFYFGLLIVSKDGIKSVFDEQVLNNGYVYPNPTQDIIFIRNSDKFEKYLIYDLIGRVVQSGVYNHKSIEVNKLPSGNYFVKLTNNFNYFISQFIKF